MSYRVISFSVWGDDPKYWVGAMRNVELAAKWYPAWVCRFYVNPDDYTRQESVELRSMGAEVCISRSYLHLYGTFWRHTVAFDPSVERYIVRDTDSRLSEREAVSVWEWIASGKPVHLMRDHPAHTYRFMCGLYGAKGLYLAEALREMGKWPKTGWRADTDFFNEVVLPKLDGDFIEHDEFHVEQWPESKPHPKRRDGFRFMGESFGPNDNPAYGWEQIATRG